MPQQSISLKYWSLLLILPLSLWAINRWHLPENAIPAATMTLTATFSPTPRPTTPSPTPTATLTPRPTATPQPTSTPTPTSTATATATPTLTATPTRPSIPQANRLQLAERLLFIDQGRQQMFVYDKGYLLRTIPVSTGKPTSRTLTRSWYGTVGADMGRGLVNYGFTVDYRWYLYPDLYGNILIHTVPYTLAGDIRHYDRPEALGVEPTSHGCIRLSEEDAAWLQEWNPVGATIQITRWPGKVKQITDTVSME